MMKMPTVSKCDVNECAYNKDLACHALAITVGDASHPRCDTFMRSMRHGGDDTSRGKVGACHVQACKFNRSLECSAPNIVVSHHQEDCADCVTFKPA